MKKSKKKLPGRTATPYLDCFADYCRTNKICREYCAFRLQCAIEKDQKMRIDLLEDLIGEDDTVLTVQ
jgi:hypothetical protein